MSIINSINTINFTLTGQFFLFISIILRLYRWHFWIFATFIGAAVNETLRSVNNVRSLAGGKSEDATPTYGSTNRPSQSAPNDVTHSDPSASRTAPVVRGYAPDGSCQT